MQGRLPATPSGNTSPSGGYSSASSTRSRKAYSGAVFEPNDDPLWERVRRTITAFLLNVWHDGTLAGEKASEAFFVKCDRSTMTQDDIDNGRLILVVGVAPLKPAEFVIFRISQRTAGY